MDHFKLVSEYQPTGDQPQAIKELVEGFKEGNQFETLLGVTGSGKTFTMANVIEKLNKPTLVIAHNKTLAAQLYGEFKEFFPENAVEYFVSYYDYYQPEAYVPTTDTFIEKDASINEEVEKLRHAATSALLSRRDVIVVASVSCIYGIGSPAEYAGMAVFLDKEVEQDRDELIMKLIDIQYDRNDYDLQRGTFRVRGDALDIFPPYSDNPLRVEFWGDEIDTMHTFDLATQRRDEPIEKIHVSPAREILFGQPADAAEKIRSYIKKARGRRRTALETCTAADLAQLDGGAMPVNMDKYLTLRYPEPATILDYFDDPLLILEEPASLREAERATAFRRGEELSALLEDGVLAAGLDKLYACLLYTSPSPRD